MLQNSAIHPILLSLDLAETREFYHDRLGLMILNENAEAIEFRCGRDTKLVVTKSTTGTSDSQTQLGWEVADLKAEITELRSRGVKIEEYDMPGLKTENGIADLGFAWAAWITDPHRNCLGILQIKGIDGASTTRAQFKS